MRLIFWRRKPKPLKHVWGSSYWCLNCGVYWWSTEPEESYGECLGCSEDDDDED